MGMNTAELTMHNAQGAVNELIMLFSNFFAGLEEYTRARTEQQLLEIAHISQAEQADWSTVLQKIEDEIANSDNALTSELNETQRAYMLNILHDAKDKAITAREGLDEITRAMRYAPLTNVERKKFNRLVSHVVYSNDTLEYVNLSNEYQLSPVRKLLNNLDLSSEVMILTTMSSQPVLVYNKSQADQMQNILKLAAIQAGKIQRPSVDELRHLSEAVADAKDPSMSQVVTIKNVDPMLAEKACMISERSSSLNLAKTDNEDGTCSLHYYAGNTAAAHQRSYKEFACTLAYAAYCLTGPKGKAEQQRTGKSAENYDAVEKAYEQIVSADPNAEPLEGTFYNVLKVTSERNGKSVLSLDRGRYVECSIENGEMHAEICKNNTVVASLDPSDDKFASQLHVAIHGGAGETIFISAEQQNAIRETAAKDVVELCNFVASQPQPFDLRQGLGALDQQIEAIAQKQALLYDEKSHRLTDQQAFRELQAKRASIVQQQTLLKQIHQEDPSLLTNLGDADVILGQQTLADLENSPALRAMVNICHDYELDNTLMQQITPSFTKGMRLTPYEAKALSINESLMHSELRANDLNNLAMQIELVDEIQRPGALTKSISDLIQQCRQANSPQSLEYKLKSYQEKSGLSDPDFKDVVAAISGQEPEHPENFTCDVSFQSRCKEAQALLQASDMDLVIEPAAHTMEERDLSSTRVFYQTVEKCIGALDASSERAMEDARLYDMQIEQDGYNAPALEDRSYDDTGSGSDSNNTSSVTRSDDDGLGI